MRVFRVARKMYCDASGEGARLYGGRWNLPGDAALYAGSSVAIALLERLTVDQDLFTTGRDQLYAVMEFDIPNDLIFTPPVASLPKGWDVVPPSVVSQAYGSKLIRAGQLCFAVPSVVDTTSRNYVINPHSTHFGKVKWQVYPLRIDPRLIR
ncbi:MAG: hypothetical protein KatS3mg032_1219 [Cyclobacteriaceae bacterium]|nr:MAG: hypothetical protein KatS3mg032_1219 [Cyclobacteriaceae bacterium]